MTPGSAIHLTISSDPAALSVVRAVAARSASMADLTLDEIDDVCIAIDEAALQLIGAGADTVRISIDASTGRLTAKLSAVGTIGDAPETPDAEVGRLILSALVDELVFGADSVTFVKRGVTV
ncbi:MAG: hypothetical protein KJN81_11065 [Acidimicrobiia bacterium]|nr:hypothetical protein [Acidimicrobiia bacterium]NNL28957.1 hypothetical protein [Acidimicrobiia bacterium]